LEVYLHFPTRLHGVVPKYRERIYLLQTEVLVFLGSAKFVPATPDSKHTVDILNGIIAKIATASCSYDK
jgi:hypothetical protein